MQKVLYAQESHRALLGYSRCKLLQLEWLRNEVLLYSTESYIQSLVIEHDGR